MQKKARKEGRAQNINTTGAAPSEKEFLFLFFFLELNSIRSHQLWRESKNKNKADKKKTKTKINEQNSKSKQNSIRLQYSARSSAPGSPSWHSWNSMGTETKVNCYAKNTSTNGGIRKVLVKGSSSPSVSASANGKHVVQLNGCSAAARATVPPPPFVPIYIDENDVVGGAKEILKVIRPHWDLSAVEFKKFTDGITNKLVGCFNTQIDSKKVTENGGRSNGHKAKKRITANTNGFSHTHNHDDDDDNNDSGNLSDSEQDENDSDEPTPKHGPSSETASANNVVLVRVYGHKTDLLIDRKAETRNIILLHSYGFAPSLYATFKNGLAYDYVPGVTLNTSNVLRPEVWRLVACRMAEMHRDVNADDGGAGASKQPHVPMLWKKTQSFFDLVPERFSDADKHKRLEKTFLPISRLRREFADLYERLEALNSPLVFAHNDILLGNVVYTESQRMVNFIDYEYADYNFQAFDIGNHFAEFAGVDEVDYSRYPKREFQYEWLRVYLQAFLNRPQVTEAEVQRLYVQVNQFALAAHYFWTIWSLIQAEHSTLDFDYVDYAFVRYKQFLARKDEFLSLEINDSS